MPVGRILESSLVLVGPGRAGTALARSWVAAGGTLRGIVASRSKTARRAAESLATEGRVADAIWPRCELLVIAVPDDRIADVAADLAARTRCRFAFHLSGALAAKILRPFSGGGTAVASLHPLRPFTGRDGENWQGALVAIEGEARAVAAGLEMARAMKANGRRIGTDAKPLYHAAATLAAGGTMALLSIAVRAAAAAGLPEDEARAGFAQLASEAAAATAHRPFAEAFTGPIARRDVQTVRTHRKAAGRIRDFFELYRRLAREILDATPGRGREEEIRAILGAAADTGSLGKRRRAAPAKPRRRPRG